MDIVEWMDHCYEEEIKSIDPESIKVKQQGISVKLSTTVKENKKGKRHLKKESIKDGYKRVICGNNILVEIAPHYKDPRWNPPRVKELRVSYDGKYWSESTSKNYKELTGLYIDYKGDNGKWNSFIENGKLVKNDKVEFAFVDAIDTKQTH